MIDIVNTGLLLTTILVGYSTYKLRKLLNAANRIQSSTQTFSKSVNQAIHNDSIYLDNTLYYNATTGELTGGKHKNELYYEVLSGHSH